MNEELKPCPFCGASFEIYTPAYCKNEPNRKKARCSNDECWAHFPDAHYDADELVELLNQRV